MAWWKDNSPIITITINTAENLAVANACDAFKKSLIESELLDEGCDIDLSFIKHGDNDYRVNLDWMRNPQRRVTLSDAVNNGKG